MKDFIRQFIIYSNYIKNKIFNNINNGSRIIALHDIDDIKLFEKKMVFLKKNYNCVSIDYLLNNKNQDNQICLTFDDGFKEWANEVYDVLQKYEIPALFFINSGLVDLNIDESKEFARKNLNRKSKLNLISSNELKKISENSLFTIGGHTISHFDLGIDTNIEKLKQEILYDKKNLEEIIGKKIDYFAYPFGRAKNISESALDILKKSEYSYCFTIIPGTVNDEKYLLPRDSLSIYDSDLYWEAWLSGAYDFKSKSEYENLLEKVR